MSKFPLVPLPEMADIFDHLREPVNQTERNKRHGPYPYYGATGQIGTIDAYKQDGKYVLLGEDGAPFLDPSKPKAYVVEGKCWVNNHAHVLKGRSGICDDDYLCIALNYADYSNAVTGSTRLKLAQGMMGNVLIPKPTLEEQRNIATRYNSQLAEVKKAKKAAEITKEELRMFAVKLKAKALQKVEELPRVPLSYYLTGIEAGKSIKTTELPARKDELGVLKVSAISWNHFEPDEAKLVVENYNPKDEHRIKKGDFIISRANTVELVGAVVWVTQDYPNRLLSDKTLRLKLKHDIDPEYLLYILRLSEARNYIEENATGSSNSMRNISQKTIYNIPIPKADTHKQSEIIELMRSTNNMVKSADEALKVILIDLDILPQKLLERNFPRY